MPILIAGKPTSKQVGFTYVMILVVVVITGIFAEVATFYVSRSRQMDREAELLYRGAAYRNAIRSYYESGRPLKTYPKSLADLVKDPRTVHKSHLRVAYPDPFESKGGGWKLLRASDGGISGLSSKSTQMPLKVGNFRSGDEKLENATSYADWIFEYAPAVSSVLVK
ncbi:MAG: type II secretion system protein [Gallionellaceae bacterium]